MVTTSPASASGLILHIQATSLGSASRQEVIAHMAATLAAQAGLPDARPLIDSAMQREQAEPTYLGKGMALPHARVAGLPCAGVCIAHEPAGILWHEERAQLIAFLAVPDEAPELYLQLMGRLVRWRLRLPDEALSAPALPVSQWEKELEEELRIQN